MWTDSALAEELKDKMKVVVIVAGQLSPQLSEVLGMVCDQATVQHDVQGAISAIYTDPPDVILVEGRMLKGRGRTLVEEFRSNAVYGHLPLVGLFAREELEEHDVADLALDDYLIHDGNPRLLEQRLRFVIARSARELDTNPLTHLPGNEAIIRTIQRSFDEKQQVAVVWADVDNFKPFNDCYGFARGDEVLLATARIITNAVRECGLDPTFVGHVGGDDFVFLCPAAVVKDLCEQIIARFDLVIGNFYNDEDLEKGHIRSVDRSGRVKEFGIMSISLAVVRNMDGRYVHFGQACGDASEIKTHIKEIDGSNYMIDRRSTNR